MSWTVLDDQSPRARKRHRCSVCTRFIEPGETYRRLRVITDDGPDVHKSCQHCELVFAEIWRCDADVRYWAYDEGLDVPEYLREYAPELARMLERGWRNIGVDEIPLTFLPGWKPREAQPA